MAKDLFEGESSSELQPNATVPEASSWEKIESSKSGQFVTTFPAGWSPQKDPKRVV